MPLKMTTKSVHSVDAHDLDAFVRATYGVDLEFAAQMESGNDVSHEFSVNGQVDDVDQKDIDNWLSGEHGYVWPGNVLNYLASSGLIPVGDYIVSVSW